MYATNYLETILLNVLKGVSATAPVKVYLALYFNSPTETGTSGTEISYSGYARQEMQFSAPAAINGGIGIQNLSDVTFPVTPSALGTITHIGILDSLTGGNMLVYGEFTESITVSANEAPVIVAGEAQWWLIGHMSNAYKAKALNFLRGTNLSGKNPYLSLFNGNPESAGSELNGGGYARVLLTFGAPTEQASGNMQIANSLSASTARATTAWGTWTYTVIYDAASSGEPMFYIQRTAKEMRKGLLAMVDVGALNVAVN